MKYALKGSASSANSSTPPSAERALPLASFTFSKYFRSALWRLRNVPVLRLLQFGKGFCTVDQTRDYDDIQRLSIPCLVAQILEAWIQGPVQLMSLFGNCRESFCTINLVAVLVECLML